MHIQTETTIMYVLRLTEQEIADALVNPAPLQDQLRAARAAHRADTDTRTDNITYSRRASYRVDGEQIARAAKKQNKKLKAARARNHFLAPTDGAFPCDQCEKTFRKQQFLNIHKSRMHKGQSLTDAQNADDELVN